MEATDNVLIFLLALEADRWEELDDSPGVCAAVLSHSEFPSGRCHSPGPDLCGPVGPGGSAGLLSAVADLPTAGCCPASGLAAAEGGRGSGLLRPPAARPQPERGGPGGPDWPPPAGLHPVRRGRHQGTRRGYEDPAAGGAAEEAAGAA